MDKAVDDLVDLVVRGGRIPLVKALAELKDRGYSDSVRRRVVDLAVERKHVERVKAKTRGNPVELVPYAGMGGLDDDLGLLQ